MVKSGNMDAANPLVSVIMSVHNGEQWLGQAIESIIHQTYSNWEFIIIDDASGNAAQQVLQQYAKADTRIKLTRKDTQQGLTRNLNTAINQCQGEYIARMDADDVSHPQRLEKQVAFLQSHPEVAMVASFIEMTDQYGNAIKAWADDRKAYSAAIIRRILPWRNCIAHPSVMIRTSVLRRYRYNEIQLNTEDWDLWLRMAAGGEVIEKINEVLLFYRVHPKSVTSTSNRHRSALNKMQQNYRNYLKGSKWNGFNFKVRLASWFNGIKLFLSRIKRSISS